jgi:hypothetical protein
VWPTYCVTNLLCDQPTVWPIYCVTNFLCDQLAVWSAYCVTNLLCDQPTVWPTYCVTNLLCDQHYVWPISCSFSRPTYAFCHPEAVQHAACKVGLKPTKCVASLQHRCHLLNHMPRVGQNRVYTHRIWPYVWWFPCQKNVYTVYTYVCMVLANPTYAPSTLSL